MFINGQKTLHRQQGVRNGPADTQVRAEGGEEALQMLEQTVPCSPFRDRGGAGGYFLKELQLAAGQGQPTTVSHNRQKKSALFSSSPSAPETQASKCSQPGDLWLTLPGLLCQAGYATGTGRRRQATKNNPEQYWKLSCYCGRDYSPTQITPKPYLQLLTDEGIKPSYLGGT